MASRVATRYCELEENGRACGFTGKVNAFLEAQLISLEGVRP